jgi:adenosylhomocysteine nucleosidase
LNIILFVALESEFELPNTFNNVEIYYTGVGKVNAAIKATSVLMYKNNKDTLVINYGSAGSRVLLKHNLYKCTSFEQIDMDARPLTLTVGETPFDESIYHNMPNVLSFDKKGYLCSTADKFQENPLAPIVDMEAYSLAKVCKIFGFEFLAYKYISDDGNPEDWENNHHLGKDLFLEVLQDEIIKRA